MPTIKRAAVSLLCGLAAAFATLPASAYGLGQVSRQSSTTTQTAESNAQAQQDVTVAGLRVNGATHEEAGRDEASSADRPPPNRAESSAGNDARTGQGSAQRLGGGSSSCAPSCVGEGQAQLSLEESRTTQQAESQARAEQIVLITDRAAGWTSNSATSSARNDAGTEQSNNQSQEGGGAGCTAGCGETQMSKLSSTTAQTAASNAEARQDVKGAQLPVGVTPSGDDGARRDALNKAESSAGNEALTSQSNSQSQHGWHTDCSSSCDGQAQLSLEESTTTQTAESEAQAEQVAVGGNGGAAGANSATASAGNKAGTKQSNYQSQTGGGSNCSGGCGGNGQAQVSTQSSTTMQTAESHAQATQNVESSIATETQPSRSITPGQTTGFGSCCQCDSASSCPPAGAASGPGSPDGTQEGTAAAESNTTIQLIWQVQLSECISQCSATKQSQTAEQQNSTVQVLNGQSQAAGAHGTQNGSAESLTQIQLGCVAYCFGTTTATPAPTLAGYAQAVEEVVRVLGQMGTGISQLAGTPAAEQGTVEQTSYQSQRGPLGAPTQVQSASQASSTVQENEPAPLIAAIEKVLQLSAAAQAAAVNETEQGIWQLQVGCLTFCNETELYQLAVQSNATVQEGASSASAASSAANSATQLIWQAQIGCLFWCYNATEQQAASGPSAAAQREARGASGLQSAVSAAGSPGQAPPEAPAVPMDATEELGYVARLLQELLGPKTAGVPTGPQQPAPPAAPGPASGTTGIAPASSGTVPGLVPVPAPVLQDGSVPGVIASSDRARGHVRAPAPDRRDAPMAGGLASQRASAGPALGAPAEGGGSTGHLAATARAYPRAGSGLLASATIATSGAALATLLSGFALFGLCVLGIAVAAARREPRVSETGAGA